MAFRDQKQMNRALHTLLALIDQGDLWTDDGPSEKYWDHYDSDDSDGGPLSTGERVIVLAVGAFWSRSHDRLSLAQAYHSLDATLSRALFSLLVAAMRPDDVDDWIVLWGGAR